jgi:hypothetical protein
MEEGAMGDGAKRITRRKVLARTGQVAAAGVAGSALGWIEIGNPPAAAANTSGEVGAAVGGRTAFAYLAQVDQDGDDILDYGYLTAIAGLDVSQLFAADPHDETTARFTFYGTATLISRVVRNNVFAIDANGSIRYFFNPTGGADFSNPDSFRAGKQIAVDGTKFHDILSVTAPNTGTPSLTAFLDRRKVSSFILDGSTYRFGHAGLLQRSIATGLGTRLDPKPIAKLTIAGDAVVTGGF